MTLEQITDGETNSTDEAERNEANEDESMSECDCDSDSGESMLEIDEYTVDAIRMRNDSVDETLTELEEATEAQTDAQETLTAVREALDIDADAHVVDAVEALQEGYTELDEEVSEYRESELDELRESIVDASTYEADELADKDKDELETIRGALDHMEDIGGVSVEDDSSTKYPTTDAQTDDSGSVPPDGMTNFDPRQLAAGEGGD